MRHSSTPQLRSKYETLLGVPLVDQVRIDTWIPARSSTRHLEQMFVRVFSVGLQVKLERISALQMHTGEEKLPDGAQTESKRGNVSLFENSVFTGDKIPAMRSNTS